jgi:hypothetical protein
MGVMAELGGAETPECRGTVAVTVGVGPDTVQRRQRGKGTGSRIQ